MAIKAKELHFHEEINEDRFFHVPASGIRVMLDYFKDESLEKAGEFIISLIQTIVADGDMSELDTDDKGIKREIKMILPVLEKQASNFHRKCEVNKSKETRKIESMHLDIIAELYYGHGMKQAEVAEYLVNQGIEDKVTQQTISNRLVTIEENYPELIRKYTNLYNLYKDNDKDKEKENEKGKEDDKVKDDVEDYVNQKNNSLPSLVSLVQKHNRVQAQHEYTVYEQLWAYSHYINNFQNPSIADEFVYIIKNNISEQELLDNIDTSVFDIHNYDNDCDIISKRTEETIELAHEIIKAQEDLANYNKTSIKEQQKQLENDLAHYEAQQERFANEIPAEDEPDDDRDTDFLFD